MQQISGNYFLSFHDQWVMVFGSGFRVDFVIVFGYRFVVVLCHVHSLNPCPWDTHS